MDLGYSSTIPNCGHPWNLQHHQCFHWRRNEYNQRSWNPTMAPRTSSRNSQSHLIIRGFWNSHSLCHHHRLSQFLLQMQMLSPGLLWDSTKTPTWVSSFPSRHRSRNGNRIERHQIQWTYCSCTSTNLSPDSKCSQCWTQGLTLSFLSQTKGGVW